MAVMLSNRRVDGTLKCHLLNPLHHSGRDRKKKAGPELTVLPCLTEAEKNMRPSWPAQVGRRKIPVEVLCLQIVYVNFTKIEFCV